MSGQPCNLSKEVKLDLFLLSAVALFFELVAIRWLSSEIRAFTIFKNFPLIACYVGFGFGYMRAAEKGRLFVLFPFLLLLLTALAATTDWTGMNYILMPGVRVGGGLFSGWKDIVHPPEFAIADPTTYVIFSVFVFFGLLVLVATTMAALGQRLGHLFNMGRPLDAYLVNLIGSAAGIAAFSFLSFLCTPPVVWVSVGCLAALYCFRKSKVAMVTLLSIIALVAFIPQKSIFEEKQGAKAEIMWSPYHRVDLIPYEFGGKPAGCQIGVNKGYFQQALNMSPDFVASLPDSERKTIEEFRFDQYELPYFFKSPKRVLIMGSGTGNDVAAALRHGAEHVDAVEIDPMMVKLGKKLHPEHPYDSPKVSVHVNDARAFLRQNKDKYDLVMTGFLDSHTVAGNSLSVRLDDYVYTVDGMKDAMAHVAPEGMYCITYCAVAPFLANRLIANLRVAAESTGTKPLVLRKGDGAIWHIIAPVTEAMRAKVPDLASAQFKDYSDIDTQGVRTSTDDWPFLYLNPISVDYVYLGVNLCILLLAWATCGASIRTNSSPKRWQLFFLGAGFLLLELAIIDRLTLVFGTTWLVNSVCIFAVLTAIIAANILIIKKPQILPLKGMYAGLLVSLILIYFTPIHELNALGMWTGGGIAAALSVIPIFMAGMIFSKSFAQEGAPAVGLAFNMLGAVIGGLLEYTASYTGIRSLLLIAFVLYAASWLLAHRALRTCEKESTA